MKKLQLFEPEPFPADAKSIDLNGVNESLRASGGHLFGFGDEWSIMMWMRRKPGVPGTTATGTPWIMSSGDARSRIHMGAAGDFPSDPIRARIYDTTGTLHKDFRWNSTTFPFDVWFQLILIWNGAGAGTLSMYKDGSLVAANVETINVTNRSMADTTRGIQIGGNGGVQPYFGFIHSMAVWNADVSSAATEIYNGGVASTFNLSKATFNANLQHWWRIGLDSSDIGKDSGIASNLIDVDSNSLNISASDVVDESPA